MKPGSRILESDLVQGLGISRTPIREALLKLEADGVVVLNRRRSYNVRVLTVDDVAETYQILGILEGAAASSVVHKITSQDVDLLKQYNDQMKQMARESNHTGYGRWNQEFHNIFLCRFGNRTLRELCDSARQLIYIFPVGQTSMAEWLDVSAQQHDEIIRLVEAKKGKELGAYFRNVHWSYAKDRQYIKDAFDTNGSGVIQP
jgi:DNA-binding GntR family transcriptional regulator